MFKLLLLRDDLTSTAMPIQVSDFYKRPPVESPAKAALEETSHMFDNRGVQLLGQIKHGSCRPRAILFKVLADTVGLESRLVVVSFSFPWTLYDFQQKNKEIVKDML